MNTNLSVIVPVFNEENAIEESVKSLLKIKNSNLDQNIFTSKTFAENVCSINIYN